MRKLIRRIISTLGLKKIFFHSSSYWEKRYRDGGNSGAGSYNRLAEFKAEIINEFCRANTIKSVIEFGCGDGNQLSLANYPHYIGLDVSTTAIEQCRVRFEDEHSKKFYTMAEANLPALRCDLAMSLDVIFHLVEQSIYENYLRTLFSAADRYVIIYSSNTDRREATHVRHHRFTDFVEQNIPAFELIEFIPNRFPFDPAQPDDTSFADFYIYKRRN